MKLTLTEEQLAVVMQHGINNIDIQIDPASLNIVAGRKQASYVEVSTSITEPVAEVEPEVVTMEAEGEVHTDTPELVEEVAEEVVEQVVEETVSQPDPEVDVEEEKTEMDEAKTDSDLMDEVIAEVPDDTPVVNEPDPVEESELDEDEEPQQEQVESEPVQQYDDVDDEDDDDDWDD